MANPPNTPPNPKPPQAPPAAPASAPKTQVAPPAAAPASAPPTQAAPTPVAAKVAALPPTVAAPAAAPPPPPVAAKVAAPPPPPVAAPPAPIAAPSTALAIAEPPKTAKSAAEAFDPALWPQKSIDLWAENASALLDFAERVANAKTVDEVTSLQSRFMSERLDALLRQSTELMTLAQRLFAFPFTPLSKAPAA